jgi:hypothetical protein
LLAAVGPFIELGHEIIFRDRRVTQPGVLVIAVRSTHQDAAFRVRGLVASMHPDSGEAWHVEHLRQHATEAWRLAQDDAVPASWDRGDGLLLPLPDRLPFDFADFVLEGVEPWLFADIQTSSRVVLGEGFITS